MDEGETKTCQNCKREIPAVNYTIHSVHCARNFRMCPVCKEPVPFAELENHHDKMHKLLPCKQCGDKVCGTDMEDHIRDSCAHTVKSCRFCELELSRRELPLHEGYCGARTEQCPDCKEWVMLKYRQLHIDSNHGFLRLDDDPIPVPKREPAKTTNVPKLGDWPKLPTPSNAFNRPSPSTSKVYNDRAPNNGYLKNINLTQDQPRTEIRYFNNPTTTEDPGPGTSGLNTDANMSRPQGNTNVKLQSKRNNNEPQENVMPMENNVIKDLPSSCGAVKKRPAPKPPCTNPSATNSSSTAGYSGSSATASTSPFTSTPAFKPSVAASNAFSSPGPSVLSATTPSVNSTGTNTSTTTAFTGSPQRTFGGSSTALSRVSNATPFGGSRAVLTERDLAYQSALRRKQEEEKRLKEINAYNLSVGLPPVLNPAEKIDRLRKMDALHNREISDPNQKKYLQGWARPVQSNIGHVLGYSQSKIINMPQDAEVENRQDDFRNLKPMTPEEFMNRFQELQLGKNSRDGGEPPIREDRGDRFSEIKSSLKELRRGLNEVTAPYNVNMNSNNNNGNERGNDRLQQRVRDELEARVSSDDDDTDEDESEDDEAAGGVEELQNVQLPCEFCGVPIIAEDLVQHQTGCRPDLAQCRRARRPSPPLDNAHIEPVIPCEFCTESLPLNLISQHQERCGREANLFFPD
ncbi:unnamed protein product [Parnassius mnemosyne]|uniref:TRAF-type domain-containing protein n=1 Tax=Parnassius mnemosyne TaxID=213953 RepID=A0AAV1L4W2_9NEOP